MSCSRDTYPHVTISLIQHQDCTIRTTSPIVSSVRYVGHRTDKTTGEAKSFHFQIYINRKLCADHRLSNTSAAASTVSSTLNYFRLLPIIVLSCLNACVSISIRRADQQQQFVEKRSWRTKKRNSRDVSGKVCSVHLLPMATFKSISILLFRSTSIKAKNRLSAAGDYWLSLLAVTTSRSYKKMFIVIP